MLGGKNAKQLQQLLQKPKIYMWQTELENRIRYERTSSSSLTINLSTYPQLQRPWDSVLHCFQHGAYWHRLMGGKPVGDHDLVTTLATPTGWTSHLYEEGWTEWTFVHVMGFYSVGRSENGHSSSLATKCCFLHWVNITICISVYGIQTALKPIVSYTLVNLNFFQVIKSVNKETQGFHPSSVSC